ncbi:MAG: hypothetical protein Q8J69_01035 [Sphingobacteriaceae bacterium]|nr:hypothetical protein [Sphingobacteriaceae bacterium]
MNASKTLLIVLLLCLSTMGWAQERVPVILYLTDGSELEGYVKPIVVGANSLTFSADPRGKLQRMRLKNVYRIKTSNGSTDFTYEVVNLRKRFMNRSLGLHVLFLEEAGFMTLYSFEHSRIHYEYFIKKSPDAQDAYKVGDAFFYNDGNGTNMSQKVFDKQFRKRGPWFFEDHPEIRKEITDKQVGTQRLRELVIRYNKDKEKP